MESLKERWRQGSEINKDTGVKNASLYKKEVIKKERKGQTWKSQTGVAVTVSFETLLHCPAVP